jgi:hypothetical protein
VRVSWTLLPVVGWSNHPVGNLVLEGEGELDSPVGEDAGSLGHCPDPLEIKRILKHVKSVSDQEISKENADHKIRSKHIHLSFPCNRRC